ncbi:hypothetical protein [Jejuia spongiicola]|uniref:T9SS C-terminal target domain-containing protein n=1 Tax=Jejuia spongiicola TaxID=2942207 RepID=A0ABT0QGT5_9FLAO|nr:MULTISPECIES: hypothetical protein [Flavobacteriaceae]MCL6296220.1 hypothetical protein [Jejuia spongiicola]PIA79188.1 hypothetical protein BFR04_06620 [Gaetbulibacter sp. 4G1]
MKKLFLILLTASTLVFTGCLKDDDTPIIIEEITIIQDGGGSNSGTPVIAVTGAIAVNTTWTNDNIYELNQKVVVQDGVTLTIEAGTIIKGKPGTGSLASALIIARGAKINAEGTSTSPIIFTSSSDNIDAGQTAGTNLNESNRGLWGGLIILGHAPCSFKGDLTEVQIEGIPADDTFGLYGGTIADDDSGILRYVSIRHGGALIGEGNEINGLTLGGVGSKTVIDNIEVVANVDDGIEFFGGTVNATNLLVWAQGDDGLDIDQAYSGTIDNAVVILGDASDHALEIDGREGTATGSFTLTNVTLMGNLNTSNGEYADFRSKATGTVSNVYAKGFKDNSDVELDNNAVSQNFLDGLITFSNWEIAGFDNSVFLEKVGCAENCDDTDETNDIPEDKIILAPTFTERAADWTTQVTDGAQTVGATTSNLNWTYANTAGGLGF